MFGKFTTRIVLTSFVAIAAIVPLTGADCATENTGGLLDPTGQLNGSQGEPSFVLEGGQIYLNGVRLLGDPEYMGYGVDGQVVTDDENAKEVNDDTSTAKTSVTNPTMRVNVKQFPVKVNTSVTFTPTVKGGTGRYWFFYKLESDANWTNAGNSYTRKLTKTPYVRLYFAAIDTNNVQSEVTTWKIPVAAEEQVPNRLCPTIAGTSWLLSDSYSKLTITLPQGQSVGAQVIGSWCNGEKTFLGRIVESPSNCSSCVVVDGVWSNPGPAILGDIPSCDLRAGPNSGQFHMTFEPELDRFSAKWSYDGSSHWEASYWSGSRSDCN